MGHWAKIDDNNFVTEVVVADDDKHDWLVENLGGRWVQTSYNTIAGEHILGGTPLRGNFAGQGFTYDEELDAFIPPKPGENWIFNEATYTWMPVEQPQ